MDFSSLPLYLDPPPNWHHQQSNHHPHQISNHGSPQPQQLLSLPIQQQLPSAPPSSHGGVTSIRRGSMSDRARMANLPLPETALKCPRCDSTNTKFCYFNNYNLSQPRHFCKTCRRYWTRGGALRNVPVGGGCRRNKKHKTSRHSKSPTAAGNNEQTNNNNNNNNSNSHITSRIENNIVVGRQHHHPHLSFMASLNNFSRFGSTNLGLNFNEIQNFPLLEGLETPMGLCPFQISPPNSIPNSNSRAPVKIEETQVLNLLKSSNLDHMNNNQIWSNNNGNGWKDVSTITSSTHHDFNH